MRGSWRVWVLAVGLSLAAHGVLFAMMRSEETLDGERSAGMPMGAWGVPVESFIDELQLVDPSEGDVEPEPEPQEVTETQETVKTVEEIKTVEQQKPTEVTETANETPVEVPATTPVETVEPEAAQAVIAPLVESSPAAVSEVKPEEVETEEEVETLTAVEPPPPPKQKKKKRVQRRVSGGPQGVATGNAGRRDNTAGRASVASYASRVGAHLRRYKRYPRGAQSRGTAQVTIVVSSNGSVRSVRLARSSGSSILDREALAMVRRAAPLPSFPSSMRVSSVTVRVPIAFSR